MSDYDLAAAVFRKSRRSGNGNACVEVSETFFDTHGVILVRDSKHPDKPPLEFNGAEWRAFVGGVRDGEFDIDL